jgi:hypothetical protein
MKRLKLSAKDEKIKAESEKADAAPSKLDSWMKEQAHVHPPALNPEIGQIALVRAWLRKPCPPGFPKDRSC